MRVDAHVARCTRQTLVLPIGNVLVGLRVYVLLGQAKVNDVDCVLVFTGLATDEKVLWFNVSIDQVLTMYIFYSVQLWTVKIRERKHHSINFDLLSISITKQMKTNK